MYILLSATVRTDHWDTNSPSQIETTEENNKRVVRANLDQLLISTFKQKKQKKQQCFQLSYSFLQESVRIGQNSKHPWAY